MIVVVAAAPQAIISQWWQNLN